jgi:hypothetical protein
MDTTARSQAYEKATVKEMRPDEDAQLVLEQAAIGDCGAQELLHLELPILVEGDNL